VGGFVVGIAMTLVIAGLKNRADLAAAREKTALEVTKQDAA
jgi:hypothetical protein